MPPRKRVCALCGRMIKPGETFTYSRWTKNYYCGPKQQERCRKLHKEKEKNSGNK